MISKTKWLPFVVPRLRDLIFIAFFYMVLVIGSMLFADGDPGRHIIAGQYMLDHHTILAYDIFSYTKAGQELTPHEWLAQIIFASANRLMGLNGVVLVTALTLATTFSLLYHNIVRQNSSPIISATITLLAGLATSLHWLARPHIFTLLYMVLWNSSLRQIMRGERVSILRFPLIMLFWANTHGAFIMGFVTLCAYFAGWFMEELFNPVKPDRRILHLLLWAGGLSFIATFINPVGWRLWETSVGYITNRFLVDLTVEYASTNFHPAISWPALMYICLVLLTLSRGWKKITWAETLLLFGWGAMGLYSVRNLPIFILISAPIIAGLIQGASLNIPTIRSIEESWYAFESKLRGILWPLMVSIACVALLSAGVRLDPQRAGYRFRPEFFPVSAVNWLKVHPQQGHMFNYFGWGGYLIYRQWPGSQVFMDGQLDFYGEKLTRQHETVMNAFPGWEAVIDEYDIRWIIIPVDKPIAQVLRYDQDWYLLYRDDTAVIYRKH